MLEAAGSRGDPRRPAPGLDILDPDAVRRRRSRGPRRRRQLRRLHGGRRRRDRRGDAPSPSTRSARPTSRGRPAAPVRAMVQLSTDYVFAGDAREPYAADAPVAPAPPTGAPRRPGSGPCGAECPRSWVVRTAWLYGARRQRTSPRRCGASRASARRLTVVDDQVGQPTWTVDLAEGIVRIVDAGAPFGIWHATGSGRVLVVRAGPGGVRGARARPRAGHADHDGRRSRCRRRGRPTACSPTTCGRPPGSSRCRTGVTPCAGPPPASSARRRPR